MNRMKTIAITLLATVSFLASSAFGHDEDALTTALEKTPEQAPAETLSQRLQRAYRAMAEHPCLLYTSPSPRD